MTSIAAAAERSFGTMPPCTAPLAIKASMSSPSISTCQSSSTRTPCSPSASTSTPCAAGSRPRSARVLSPSSRAAAGGARADDAAIGEVALAVQEAVALQPVDDPGHRLLRDRDAPGELAHRERPVVPEPEERVDLRRGEAERVAARRHRVAQRPAPGERDEARLLTDLTERAAALNAFNRRYRFNHGSQDGSNRLQLHRRIPKFRQV